MRERASERERARERERERERRERQTQRNRHKTHRRMRRFGREGTPFGTKEKTNRTWHLAKKNIKKRPFCAKYRQPLACVAASMAMRAVMCHVANWSVTYAVASCVMCVCVCVCVRARACSEHSGIAANTRWHARARARVHMYTYMYICAYVSCIYRKYVLCIYTGNKKEQT